MHHWEESVLAHMHVHGFTGIFGMEDGTMDGIKGTKEMICNGHDLEQVG